jgi:uncharacterized delta-60 repeat protein
MNRSKLLWVLVVICMVAAGLYFLQSRAGYSTTSVPNRNVGDRFGNQVSKVGGVVSAGTPTTQASGNPTSGTTSSSAKTGPGPSYSTNTNGPSAVVTEATTPVVSPSNQSAPVGTAAKPELTFEEKRAAILSVSRDLTDPKKREELMLQLKALDAAEQESVRAKAKRLGLAMAGDRPGGGRFELVGFEGDRPIYNVTENVNAAISTGANLVRSTAPFNVDGTGWTFGLWEAGGIPRASHQEFGSPTKVTVRDGFTTVSDHATHVAGTLAALGVNVSLRGMAPGALISAYSSGSDVTEMSAAGAAYGGEPGKIYISNHSYGFFRGWDGTSWYGAFSDDGNPANDTDEFFGRYNATSVSMDAMLASLPYFLPFMSSGNHRDDGPPAAGVTWTHVSTGLTYAYNGAQHPAGDGIYKVGYDNMDEKKVCKNLMTVGAANDAVSGGVRSVVASTITAFSSTGPTDDGRIKPDIVANGASLLSSGMSSDTASYNSSGTSMSSPNAAGSAMLLMDYFGDRFPGQYMRASTLKALIIHTADDIGNPGPDYFYGWGLMNTKAAAEHIKREADSLTYNGITEATVTTAEPSDSYTFRWNGSDPIRVTLCWTDPAGTAVNAHDDRARDLVNDLNVSVSGPTGSVHLPFVMPYVGTWTNASLSAHAITGVNTVDNVEQVLIPAPPALGLYTVTVDRAGALSGGSQTYSLIISGQATDDLAVSPAESFLTAGSAGGPFTPASKTYTLLNQGTSPLDWSASSSQGWMSVAPASGTLNGGASVNVLASPTVAANSLSEGNYTAALTFTNTTSGNTSTREAGLSVARAFYRFSMDTDPGWAVTGQWAYGVPQGLGGDPTSGRTGSNVYGYNLAGAYSNSMPEYTLTTSALDCSNKEHVSLGFWRWLGVESSTYDQASVQVSRNGADWTTVWAHSGSTVTSSAWTYVEYDISAIADDQPTVYVRWVLGPTDSSVTYAGWNIDDVELLGDSIPPRPEIAVHDGATTASPELSDEQAQVVDFGFTPMGVPVTRSFTVANTGNLPLNISSVTGPAGFTVLGAPSSVSPGNSSTFQIRFDATTAGQVEGSVVITSNDADEGTFDFPVRASVDVPDIAVAVNGQALTDGQTTVVQYLSTAVGISISRSFVVSNVGINALNISAITPPLGFTVVGAPSSILGGSSATFQLRLDATAPGVFSGALQIASNDPDEPVFDFPVLGTVLVNAVPPGTLDTSFGGTGIATASVGVSSVQGYAVALQADGKTLAGGRAYVGGDYDFFLVRYNADGSLDTTFGTGGHVITRVSNTTDEVHKILVQPDGKILAGGQGNSDFAIVRYNTDGTLDTTFDGDGILLTPILSGTDYIRDMEFQADGKLVAVGAAFATSNYDFAAVRYNTDFTLDTTFDADGKVTVAVAAGNEYAEGVAVQPDGKIVLAGYGSNGTNDDFAMVRLTSAGALDTTFGATGKFLTTVGTGADTANAVALQADGKIVVGGRAASLGMALVRYNSDGSLDTTFDSDGRVTTIVSTGTFGIVTALAVLPDGKLLASGEGYTAAATNTDFAIVRYLSTGALDTTYGPTGNGRSVLPVANNNNAESSQAMVVHADGKATMVGFTTIETQRRDLAVVRVDANGLADPEFTADGTVEYNPLTSSADFGFGMALAADGKVTLAGYSHTGVQDDFSAAQWLPNGSLNASFGTAGVAWLFSATASERCYAAVTQPDGKTLLGGYFGTNSLDFQVARLNVDGALDSTFDTDGRVSTTIGTGAEIARAMVLQPDGKIVAAGYSSNGSNDDFALVRYNSNGSLDSSFDGDGRVTTMIGTGTDQGFAALLLPDGKIMVAGSAAMASTDFAVARYTSAGALDTTFDADGKATFTMGAGIDIAYGIARQSSGKIIVAGDATADFGLLRLNANGSIDTTFGVGGRAITPIGSGTDTCYAVAVQPDDKIVAVGRTFNGTNYDIAVVRYTAEGRLDTTFGTGGKVIAAPGTGDDYANAVIVQPDASILVGGYTFQGPDAQFLVLRLVGDSLKPKMVLHDGDTSASPTLRNGQATPVEVGFTTVGAPITHDFTIVNMGTADLTVSRVTVPLGFTALNVPSVVPADGEVTFQVRLDGTSAGFFTGNLVLSSNDADQASFVFPVRGGVGVPELVVSAEGVEITDGQSLAIPYRSTPQGVSVTKTFVIQNIGTADLTLSSISPPSGFTLRAAPASVAPGSSAAFQVTLTAASVGNYGGNVVIHSNDPDESSFELPVSGAVVNGAVNPGQLDTSFSGDGIATVPGGGANDEAYAVLALNDGKTLIGGSAYVAGDTDFLVSRLNTDGTLDSTFGVNGVVLTRVGSSLDRVYSLAVQQDGKYLAGGYTWNGSNYDFALVRYLEDGRLDTTFDSDGIVSTSVGLLDDIAWKVLVQADGKILVAGQSNNGVNQDFAVVRYTSSGALDPTFGTNGVVVTAIGTGADIAYSADIQTDGKIVLAGYSYNGSNDDFAIVRYLVDGSLDSTFGTGGKVTTAIGTSTDRIHDVVIQPDGKILAGGYMVGNDFALARYNTDGTLDTMFGINGKVTTAIGTGTDWSYGIALQADGKIVAAGYSITTGMSDDFAVARYTAGGALDVTFDGDGKKVLAISVGNNSDVARDVAIHANGDIVIAGYMSKDSSTDVAVVRLDATDGSLKPGFGTDGVVSFNAGIGSEYGLALALQPDQRIVAAGYTNLGGGDDCLAARLLPDGSPDNSYGTGGKVISRVTPAFDRYHAVVVQKDGKVLLGGYAQPSSSDFLVMRQNGNGTPDMSFGNNGVVITSIGTGTDIGRAMILDDQGLVTVVGGWNNGISEDYALARYTTEGALDGTFGVGGLVTTAGTLGTDRLQAAAIYPGGRIMAVGETRNTANTSTDFGLARYNSDGSLDASFGTGGRLTLSPVGGTEILYAVLVLPDGRIVAAGDASGDAAIIRLMPDGSYDTTFGNSGRMIVPILSSVDTIYALALQPDGKVVAAGRTFNGSNYDIAVLRFLPNGFLDPSFDEDGKIVISYGTGDDYARAVVVQDDGALIVGGYTVSPGVSSQMLVLRLLPDALTPAISVTRNDTAPPNPVVDGQAEVIVFGQTTLNQPITKTFSLHNTGSADLLISSLSVPAGFTVLSAPTSVAAGETAAFQVRLNAAQAGLFVGSVVIASNDAAHPSFDFPVTGSVQQPKIALSFNGSPLMDSQANTIHFGSTLMNASVSRTFTLSNVGFSNLVISSITAPTGFTVESAPSLVSEGTTITFQVRLDALAAGTFSGNLVIQSNDLQTASFEVPVAGIVMATLPPQGQLDPAFGNGGVVLQGITSATDQFYCVTQQADGKLLAAGRTYTGGRVGYDALVVRYNLDGTLDNTFGTGGILIYDVNGNSDIVSEVLVQPDGKIVLTGVCNNGSNDDMFALRLNADGTLDNSFSGDGEVIITIGTGTDYCWAAALQPDGKILLAGYYNDGVSDDIAVVRLTSAGALDTSFGTAGRVTTALGTSTDRAYSIALQADGGIVVGGYAIIGLSTQFALVRYTTSGALDTTFDTDGKVTTLFGSGGDAVWEIDIQSDGKIIAGGYSTQSGSGTDFSVARYNTDGSLDTTFDGDGKTSIVIGNSTDWLYSLDLQSDGKIVGTGITWNGSNYDIALVRFLPSGLLDGTLDTDGIATFPIQSGSDYGRGIRALADGRIAIAGYAASGSDDDSVLLVTTDSGQLDATFGSSGMARQDFGDAFDAAYAMQILPDDRIYLAANGNAGPTSDFQLTRLLSNGTPDTSVPPNGITRIPVGTSSDLAYALAVQPDGKTLLAGYAFVSNNDFGIIRLNVDGTLDSTFAVGGKSILSIGSGDDIARAVALQPDGKILVAGYSSNGSNDDFALVRLQPNGAVDASFGVGGIVTTAIGSGLDRAWAMALQPDGKIVLAGQTRVGALDDFAMARYNSNGSLDTSFGSGGKVITQLSANFDDIAYAIQMQPDGKILLGGWVSDGVDGDSAVARYLSNGSLDGTFGSGGVSVISVNSSLFDGLYGLGLQPDGRILAAGYSYNGTDQDMLAFRLNADGTLDTTFATGGISVLNPSPGRDQYAWDIATQSDGSVVVGGWGYIGNDGQVIVQRYTPHLRTPALAIFAGATTAAPPLAHAQALAVDFGVVTPGTQVTRTFTLQSTGTDDLILSGITTPSSFTFGSALPSAALAPTQTYSFQITLNAPLTQGPVQGHIRVTTNASDVSAFDIPVSAFVASTGYQTWALSYSLGSVAAGHRANPMGDGIANLTKYAFNLDPTVPTAAIMTPGGTSGLPSIQLVGTGASRVLRFEFLRRIGSGLTYQAQATDNISAWQPTTASPIVTAIDATWERVIVEEPAPDPALSRLYGRVKVTLP